MRRIEKAVTSLAELEQILWQGKVCQLAIPDQPVPYLVPLNYGYRDEVFYFHSAAEGRKIELLKSNPLVSFSVVIDLGVIEAEQACNWGARFRSVVGQGRVEFIEEMEQKRSALQLLMAQYSDGEFDLPDAAVAGTTVFKLTIEQMVGKQSRA
jgi:nitroimidazol reductase NimA-like FMN-containing flavoprotein (pyridoxamine 5'-phosphate oxidase superfamily)